jgi:hypothetical protein
VERIAPRDIRVSLNKVTEEKKTDGSKEEEEQDKIDSEKNQTQAQHPSVSA